MSTPIPEDVMDQARALVDVLEGMPSHGNVLLAARFLMAERAAADERAAKIADKHADGRRTQSKDMTNTAKERRDFESMSIACVQVASAIRDRSKS